MADTDVWGLGAIASPAGTDRVPVATTSGAGGYSPRSHFVWRDASGDYKMAETQFPRLVFERAEIGTWSLGYDGQAGSNSFALRLNGGASMLNVSSGGLVGIGIGNAVASAKLHVLSSAEIARFETTTARGSGNGYIGIGDPTGRKAFIGYGTSNDDLHFMNESSGQVGFGNGGTFRWAINTSGHFYPIADNTYSLGVAGGRASVVYAATGTINTSDAAEKEWLGAGFSSALLSAAKRIAAEIGSYKWLAAIAPAADGGPAARIHFGVRAQAVWAIMADEGLIDPIEEGVTPTCPYAFLCYDEWEADAEAGIEAGHRFGIRPDQLAMFLIAAQEARLTALEAA